MTAYQSLYLLIIAGRSDVSAALPPNRMLACEAFSPELQLKLLNMQTTH